MVVRLTMLCGPAATASCIMRTIAPSCRRSRTGVGPACVHTYTHTHPRTFTDCVHRWESRIRANEQNREKMNRLLKTVGVIMGVAAMGCASLVPALADDSSSSASGASDASQTSDASTTDASTSDASTTDASTSAQYNGTVVYHIANTSYRPTSMTTSNCGTAGFDTASASYSVTYTADAPLCNPDVYNTGTGSLFSKAYFIGWSTDANYATDDSTDGGLFFASTSWNADNSPTVVNDSVSTAFPDGLNGGTTDLYAVYIAASELSDLAAGNEIYINRGLTAQQTLSGSILDSSGFDTEESADMTNRSTKNIVGDADSGETHTLDLTASFRYQKLIAAFTYLNPNNKLNHTGGQSTVDLHFKLDSRITAKDVLQDVKLVSAAYEPYSLIIGSGDSTTETVLDASSITENDADLSYTFDLPLNGATEFTLRCHLRSTRLNLTSAQVLAPMTLSSDVTDDFTIAPDVASTLATSGDKLVVDGNISGEVRFWSDSWGMALPYDIPEIDAQKPLNISFANSEKAAYSFVTSGDGAPALPDDVAKLLPTSVTARRYSALSSALADTSTTDDVSTSRFPLKSELTAIDPEQLKVETADGTWTFEGWDAASKTADSATDGPVTFVGTWSFTPNAANASDEPSTPDAVPSDGASGTPAPAGTSDAAAPADDSAASSADAGASSAMSPLAKTGVAVGALAVVAAILAGVALTMRRASAASAARRRH